MSNAIDRPVITRGKREIHTGDMQVPQKPSVNLDTFDEDARKEHSTVILEATADNNFLEQLAYAEQPVTIRVERSSEKNAPRFADCYVNGRGAELLHQGKWQSVGWIPCGVVVTTKRKYVEVLMRSRPDDCETDVIMHEGQDPFNKLNFTTRQKFPISIIEDKHPIDPSGYEWASRIMSE